MRTRVFRPLAFLSLQYHMSCRTANDTSDNGFQKRMVRGVLFVTLEQPMRVSFPLTSIPLSPKYFLLS